MTHSNANPILSLAKSPSFQQLRMAFRHQTSALNWGGFWGSSKALASAALAQGRKGPLLVVVSDADTAVFAVDDLLALGAGAVPFPAREGALGAEAEVLRERHHALDLANRPGFCGILVAPLSALLQPAPDQTGITAPLQLSAGMEWEPEEALRHLVTAGFERVPSITEPGQVALRGDILDFLAPALGEPLRLEFFDDEVESIRVFDLSSQRTRHVLEHVLVPLNRDLADTAEDNDPLPTDRMPSSARLLLWDPAQIEEAAGRMVTGNSKRARTLIRLRQHALWQQRLELTALPGRDGTLDILSVEEYCRGVVEGASLLAERAADGEEVHLLCSTEAERLRVEHLLAEAGQSAEDLHFREGGLATGFRVPEARLTVLHHRELVPGHGRHRPRPRSRRDETAPIADILALKPGDIVVHAVHGLALFRGLDAGAEDQDVLILEFDDKATLHVPASRVDLVERYVGAGGNAPHLDRLGSGSFLRRRAQVEQAVQDLAADLLEVQASRLARPGTAFAADEDCANFAATFPWEDTPDQAQGTREIQVDLGQDRPMDRLVCGDVGYGKTELAARASFQVMQAGWQVAILAPTTVLAEQHFQTLRQRFADWPLHVEVLSRLVKPTKRNQILAGLKEGTVDLLVGTHRILSRDVSFRRLGLVIVDEEQRFGVRAKDGLKRKREQVDVLTLSATPIPRTLHMAMAGLRDITSLSTAPPGRREVHTEIRWGDEDDLIADAINRELERGGQVFFVHNRVRSLEKMASRLRRLAPNARVDIAHGQMPADGIEQVMLDFVRGETDVLCCTTIIESGLDIPNANTIFIDDAHRYGLADLHQLRGRVGRSERRGWCWLLIPRGQPLPLDARRRLKAVEELRYLGAGFQIALRDLEIRGAGNLLGSEQSGHIAAVGYETYRRLLSKAVQNLKAKRQKKSAEIALPRKLAADLGLAIHASIPPSWIPDEASRLAVLREFDSIRSVAEADRALDALRDRFGPPPVTVVRLAQLFFLKNRLGEMGFESLQRSKDRLVCTVGRMRSVERALKGQGVDFRVITPKVGHWILPHPAAKPEKVLAHLLAMASSCSNGQASRKSIRRIHS